MFYRKSFLVFVLAFAMLTLGGSQEARAECAPDDYWCLLWESPLQSNGGSKNLVYTCDEGQGTNSLILNTSPIPDQFIIDGSLLCNFTGKEAKGTGIQCDYHVEFNKDGIVECVDTSTGSLVTVITKCTDLNVFGTLHCASQDDGQGGIFPEVTDLVGISNPTECQTLYGNNGNTLFSQATFVGQTCAQVLASNQSLVLGGLTTATTHLCHSDGEDTVDCIIGGNSNNSNKSESAVPQLGETACDASPNIWNISCGSNRDQGNGTACLVNGGAGAGVFSFDPNALDPTTATLNGVPADTKKGKPLCEVKDCNGDQIPDFECSFHTCSEGLATAARGTTLGDLTMVVNFQGNTGGGLTCTTHVGTSGQ
jgi:hypothetical protein